MLFMSSEHVAAMNELLDASADVRIACAALPQPRVMAYALEDGPDGRTVHWAVSFHGTVRFSLDPAPEPDVLLRGDWRRMMRASDANRRGETADPDVSVEGDVGVLEEIGPVLELARSVATLDVEFPQF
jgi:hypothetical protein